MSFKIKTRLNPKSTKHRPKPVQRQLHSPTKVTTLVPCRIAPKLDRHWGQIVSRLLQMHWGCQVGGSKIELGFYWEKRGSESVPTEFQFKKRCAEFENMMMYQKGFNPRLTTKLRFHRPYAMAYCGLLACSGCSAHLLRDA